MMVELSAPFIFVLNGPMDCITYWVAYSGMPPDYVHKLRFSSSIVIFVTPRRNWFAKNNLCFQPWTFVTANKNFREHWRTCSNETETSNTWKKQGTDVWRSKLLALSNAKFAGCYPALGLGACLYSYYCLHHTVLLHSTLESVGTAMSNPL